MTITQQVLVLAGTIDEGGLSVEEEPIITIVSLNRPRNTADTERRAHFVGGLAITFDHCSKGVEIGIGERPAVGVLYRLSLTDGLGFAWQQ